VSEFGVFLTSLRPEFTLSVIKAQFQKKFRRGEEEGNLYHPCAVHEEAVHEEPVIV